MARSFNKFSSNKEEKIPVAVTDIETDFLGSEDIFLKIDLKKSNKEHLPVIFTPHETKRIYLALKNKFERPRQPSPYS